MNRTHKYVVGTFIGGPIENLSFEPMFYFDNVTLKYINEVVAKANMYANCYHLDYEEV